MKHFMYDPITEFILELLISGRCYQYHSIVHFNLLAQYLKLSVINQFMTVTFRVFYDIVITGRERLIRTRLIRSYT